MSHFRPTIPVFAPSSVPGVSCCFRTDAEGRIALACDWRALFHAVSRLGAVAVQSRHAYARLVHLGPLPTLAWSDDGLVARDETGALHLHCTGWSRAWGRLALCPCCESPGRIGVHNVNGAEFLQLCPMPQSPPAEWAECLARLTTGEMVVTESTQRGFAAIPLLPDGLQPVAATGAVLPDLLSALGAEAVRLRVLMGTAEMTQVREFTPRCVSTDYPLLIASDIRVTVQLALPPVQGLGLADDGSLHVVGPGGTLLLSLIAAGPAHTPGWRAAIQACLPTARFKPATP
jgi:hypothetical protein